MRSFFPLLAVLVLASTSARAEALAVDEALLVDTTSFLEDEGKAPIGASNVLPLLLETSRQQASSSPQGKTIGLGVQIGAPTALTLKFMTAADQGVVVGIGAGFGWGCGGPRGGFCGGLSIHGDYLFDVAQLVNNGTINLSLYLGPGVWIAIFNSGYGFGYGVNYYPGFAFFGVGARLPIGLSLGFAAVPIEVYLELDPTLWLFPGIDFGLGATLGFRFYF